MAFEGALLGAAIAQALAAIPGAVFDIKNLIKGGRVDEAVISNKLDTLSNHISDFCKIDSWLQEAKNLHDYFQRFDDALEKARAEYLKATTKGSSFDIQSYKVAVIRELWVGIKMSHLAELLSCAQSLTYTELEPLVLDKDDKFVSGPDWTLRLINYKSEINKIFHDFDIGKTPIRDLADQMNQLSEYVKNLMHLVNQHIKNEASELGKALNQLSGNLKKI